MTQHSTQANSPLARSSLRGRLRGRFRPVGLALVAALLLAVPVLFGAGPTAHAADKEITGLTLSSPNPGELVIAWDAASPAPNDHRVMWAKSSEKFLSYKKENTDEAGNAYPTGTTHTVTGLPEGEEYKVRVRARYGVEKPGPFSDPATVTISSTPEPTTAPEVELPAKPTGLNHGASHFSVLLIWTDPDDDSITGYQVLRGPDAASLSVLADDTGSATSSYTDNSVEAETTYVYAVRARNAGGLGPQSDPVTVTTLSAPPTSEEPRIARAVAGANFTLDGQALDTTDTCDDDDISNIAAACTIDIDTADVVFAVDGEVDSDDRLTVKTGRDKDNLTEHADQGDLRGTDQGVDLTFLPGRSLLRIWGDEDESSGGGEEHFFRVNLVPYWELNGDRLSKSDDCKSTTDRTASEITDDDCIVTQFGNTAKIQFSNVIHAQFNVYVHVNTTEIVKEPGDSDLANPFALDLQDGDNVIKVRLASKGGAHGALSYGSNSFYYKVTTTDVLVSNLGQSTSGTKGSITTSLTAYAVPFTTGNHPSGYSISKVRLLISASNRNVAPRVSIRSDNSGTPGSSLKTLTNPSSVPLQNNAEADFDADDYKLDRKTPYWIMIERTNTLGTISIGLTADDDEDDGAAAEWEIGDVSRQRLVALGTEFWNDAAGSMVGKIAIKGELAKSATLSGLALQDPNGNAVALAPTFDSDTTDYDATANSAVRLITVNPTTSDDGATIEYLDENDMDLADADPTTMDVFDVDLDFGPNIFKVKVTGGDTTTETYTITVTRTTAVSDETTDCAGDDSTSCTFGVGQPGTGEIDPNFDIDWWFVTLEAGKTYIFQVRGPASNGGTLVDPETRLLDRNRHAFLGHPLLDVSPSGTTDRDAKMVYTVPAGEGGNYYLDVSKTQAATGTYTVEVTEFKDPPTLDETTDCLATTSTTCTLSVPGEMVGEIGPTSSDVDWWGVTLAEGIPYVIEVKGLDSLKGTLDDPVVALRDNAGTTELAMDDDGGDGVAEAKLIHTIMAGTAGKHFIAVSSGSDKGSYTVSVRTVRATLSALVLRDESNNVVTLAPTFASDTTSYEATVANTVSRIKVEPHCEPVRCDHHVSGRQRSGAERRRRQHWDSSTST